MLTGLTEEAQQETETETEIVVVIEIDIAIVDRRGHRVTRPPSAVHPHNKMYAASTATVD